MHTTDNNIQPGPIDPHQLAAHRYQCHHTFPDGARCGSPALRNETRCYYHHESRKPVSNLRDRNARMNTFELPFPDSRTSVQAALGDLMARISSNDIDPRRAGLLLYCLQLAQSNLKASELAVQQQSPATAGPQSDQPFSRSDEASSRPQEASSRPEQETAKPSLAEWRDPRISSLGCADTERCSNLATSPEVQTDLSCFEDFAQKTGEGQKLESGRNEAGCPTHGRPHHAWVESEAATHNPAKGTPISRATFAVLLESLARHHGINVDDPIYTNHNEDSPILAALRAEAANDEVKPAPLQRTTDNLQLTTALVILNHSNAKQTNCSHHPRRLGLPCREARKRHRSGPQANLRQASGDLPQHPHPRQ